MSSPAAVEGASARLRAKLELVLPVHLAAGGRLVAHPRIRELDPRYLAASHGIIRASVPLMRAALGEAQTRASDDPVAAGLAEYLEKHVDEEVGHDDWLLEDLEVLGVPAADVVARPPSPSVATLVGAQYYWALHHHPVTVLGYVALLEGYPPSIEDVDRLIQRTGYPREAFRTLIRHAELDPLHRDELDEALDGRPLRPEHEDAIALAALHSVYAFARVVEDLLAEADAAAA